ncbi:YerC/YecD family TrpR-related protein [Litorimonas sp. RW-G-Af-16]|uniref:YerC/YecD family TrpR-related protein n=1 Tax=Litorimonas sp. RW-G-Af-16 TaxID=3241168 RepID=UPI00390CBEC7
MTDDTTYQALAEALVRVSDTAIMRSFLTDLCTPAELRALSERWHVAKLLQDGQMSYRDINAETGVSTTTIGRVARFLRDEPHGGYRALFEIMETDRD